MIKQTSPRTVSRVIGLLFLLTIAGGIVAQTFISERLIRFNDAAATANNILAHPGLFRLGYSVYLFEMACQIATAALWFRLLKPVNGNIAVVFLVLELTGCVVKTAARVFYLTPLWVLGTAVLPGFTPEQVQSLALVLLKVNDYGAATALAFFGFATVLNGYLVFRSGFLPRWLGALGMAGGFGWLTFIYPPLGYRVFMFSALIALLGAASMILWLFVRGVDEAKWRYIGVQHEREQTSRSVGRTTG